MHTLAEDVPIIPSNVDVYNFQHRDRVPQGQYFCAIQVDSKIQLKKIKAPTTDTMASGYDCYSKGFVHTTNYPTNTILTVNRSTNFVEGPIQTWHYNQRFLDSC